MYNISLSRNKIGHIYFAISYYDTNLFFWLSVDPMADKYPSLLPYIYSANNPIILKDPNGLWIDDHYINNDGTVRSVKTDDSFDRFYVQDKNTSGYNLVAQLEKNSAGLVKFPSNGSGFNRYGIIDAGGISTSPSEIVGEGDHYLQPIVAAALFGLLYNLDNEYGFNISLGDMSSSNGSDPWQLGFAHHAGHGHLGNRSGMDIDFRYLNNEGNSFQSSNAFASKSFSISNNQILYNIACKFGFTKNFMGKSGNLVGVKTAAGHDDHGHFGFQYENIDWKYIPNAPTNTSEDIELKLY